MFKVGDKVRIKRGSHSLKVGSQGTIEEKYGDLYIVLGLDCWDETPLKQSLHKNEMELLKTRYKMFKKIQEWWNGLFNSEPEKEEEFKPFEFPSHMVEEVKMEYDAPLIMPVKSKPAKKKRAVKKSPAKKRGKKT